MTSALRLLSDVRDVAKLADGCDGLPTSWLLSELNANPEAPWSSYGKNGMTARDLSGSWPRSTSGRGRFGLNAMRDRRAGTARRQASPATAGPGSPTPGSGTCRRRSPMTTTKKVSLRASPRMTARTQRHPLQPPRCPSGPISPLLHRTSEAIFHPLHDPPYGKRKTAYDQACRGCRGLLAEEWAGGGWGACFGGRAGPRRRYGGYTRPRAVERRRRRGAVRALWVLDAVWPPPGPTSSNSYPTCSRARSSRGGCSTAPSASTTCRTLPRHGQPRGAQGPHPPLIGVAPAATSTRTRTSSGGNATGYEPQGQGGGAGAAAGEA
jgi:uncharacterized protein DUF3631